MAAARLIAVNRHNPCPVCGRFDNCSIREDGSAVICGRIGDGAVKQARDGRWFHQLSNRPDWQPTPMAQVSELPQALLATIQQRHAVYTAMLEALTLEGQHADNLCEQRGLSDTHIAYNLYASLPNRKTAQNLCHQLAQQFDLAGVPGFYLSEDHEDESYIQAGWELNLYRNATGFLIPIRDLAGRIQALQIRGDGNNIKGSRYFYLSSKGKREGVSCGQPTHFAGRDFFQQGECIITEGALKAEVIAQHFQCAVIGLASALGQPSGLTRLLQQLGITRVYIAFDADWRTNPQVKTQLGKLGQMLKRAGQTVSLLEWESDKGKGLDDVLTTQAKKEAA